MSNSIALRSIYGNHHLDTWYLRARISSGVEALVLDVGRKDSWVKQIWRINGSNFNVQIGKVLLS